MSGARYPRLVLLLAAERCELQLNRTGMRQYSVRVRQGDSTATMGSEEGIPSTRMAAIDRALELGEQLGLVDPVIRQRSRVRRALAHTEPCPKRDYELEYHARPAVDQARELLERAPVDPAQRQSTGWCRLRDEWLRATAGVPCEKRADHRGRCEVTTEGVRGSARCRES